MSTQDTEQNQSARQNRRGENKTRKYIMFGVLGVAIIAAIIYGWNWYSYAQSHESTDNAQVEGHISPIIPRVDGYVDSIYVDDNEHVEKGQLLASIDKDKFEVNVKEAKASLEAAEAAYADAKAGLATARAQEQQDQVTLKQAKSDQQRQKRLLNDHSTTQQQYDNAQYAYESAQARYKVAQRQVNAAQVKVQQAQANIEKAQSALDNSQLQLSYTELHAPIAGRVSKKNIETGQYVTPGSPIMAIANDNNVWIVANFKEGQIAQIKGGQAVDIEVDAYPDTMFKGTVQSIGGATGSKFALLPPDNASGNFVKVEQRIPVKITFNNLKKLDKPLKPGMNAVPTVEVN